jgi:hypothetical protein
MSNSRAMATSLVGAKVDDVAGYLFFTEQGRMLSRRIEPALDDVARRLTGFRSTMHKTAEEASKGGNMLNEAMGDRQLPQPAAAQRQSWPF